MRKLLTVVDVLLLSMLTACAAGMDESDSKDPGLGAAGGASERPAIAPKDVGVSLEGLSTQTAVNSNVTLNCSTPRALAMAALYAMRYSGQGIYSCTGSDPTAGCTLVYGSGPSQIGVGGCLSSSSTAALPAPPGPGAIGMERVCYTGQGFVTTYEGKFNGQRYSIYSPTTNGVPGPFTMVGNACQHKLWYNY